MMSVSGVLSLSAKSLTVRLSDKVIDFIRNNDKGDGIDIEDVVKKFDNEEVIKNLLSEGELFEITM